VQKGNEAEADRSRSRSISDYGKAVKLWPKVGTKVGEKVVAKN
jgi:hypothetical protein